MSYNYIPKYIRQSETKRPKDVITAARWNELFNLLIEQGDYTAEELGKILGYLSTGLEDLASDKLDKTGGIISGDLAVTGEFSLGSTVAMEETNESLLTLRGDNGEPVRIRNVDTPFADNDAVNKKYVDEHSGGGNVEDVTVNGESVVTDGVAEIDLDDYALKSDLPYVTPEDFGAVGDGVADDTSAVQQAVNSGKSVFANGTYKITQTISVSNGLNLVGGTFAIESTDSSSMRGCFDVDAQDLNVSISGAKFTSTRDKTSFAPTGHTRESGSKSSNVIAIMARGFDNLIIENCVFENMEYDVKSMSPSTGVLCGNNLLLSGCKSNNASNAVFVMRTTNFVCDGCYFEPATLLGTGDHVFYIEKMVGSVEISNIRIEAQDDYIGYVFNFNDASNTQQAVSAKVDNCYVSAPRFISSFADNCTVNATTYISTYNGADNARGHIFSQAGHMSFVNCIIDCHGLEIGEYFRDCIFSGCDLHGRFQISSAVSPTNIQIFGSYLHCDNSSANSYIMYVERENAKVLISGCKLSTYGSSMMSLRKSTATLRVIGCDICGSASRVFYNGSADTAYELIGNRITVSAIHNPSDPHANAIIQLNVFGAQTYLDADGVQSLVSGKQDAILDLATIRSGAALGATALQSVPNTYALKTDLPTKTSDLTNDSGFLDDGDTQEASTLTIDSVVTSGSNNLVTSGAVYSFIATLDGNGVAY